MLTEPEHCVPARSFKPWFVGYALYTTPHHHPPGKRHHRAHAVGFGEDHYPGSSLTWTSPPRGSLAVTYVHKDGREVPTAAIHIGS